MASFASFLNVKVVGLDLPFSDGGSRAVSPTSGSNIIAAARNAYSKIISGLQTEFTGRVLGEEAWHERYSGFRGELVGLLGLGLQKWLAKSSGSGLTYISSQVGCCYNSNALVFFESCFPSLSPLPPALNYLTNHSTEVSAQTLHSSGLDKIFEISLSVHSERLALFRVTF